MIKTRGFDPRSLTEMLVQNCGFESHPEGKLSKAGPGKVTGRLILKEGKARPMKRLNTPDIVARLRARNERFQAMHGNLGYYGSGDSILDCEAADEIERLQKYAARLIERLERAPDETRAIDADIASRKTLGEL